MGSYYVGFLDSDEPHFLEYCSLCRKTLSLNSDIFMYRGDMAICSQECRQEQIESDETKSKSWRKTSSSRSSLRKSSDSKDSVAVRTKNSRHGLVITSSSDDLCKLDVELNKERQRARTEIQRSQSILLAVKFLFSLFIFLVLVLNQ